MDIDRAFISHLVTSDTSAFKYAIKNIPFDIVEGDARKIYKWIIEYYRNTRGHLPSPQALVNEFKGYKLLRATDRVEYYESKFKERKDYKVLTIGVTSIGNMLFNENVKGAKEEFRNIAMTLGRTNEKEMISAKSGLTDRKRAYLDAKKKKGKIGFYIGIPTFDKHLGGLQKEFFIIMGYQGIGKTFLSLMISCGSIWKELTRPILFVSNEMDTESIYKRIDSLLGEFSHSKYRKGLLNEKEETRFKNLTRVYNNLSELYVISGAGKHVTEIEYDVIALEPQLLIVDGIYLTDMGKNDKTADTIAASSAYQRIGKKYGIPVIATSQMIDGQTKYAKALQEDADIVLKMWWNQGVRDAKLMGLNFFKIREEDNRISTYMNWDFDTWNFGEADITKGMEAQFNA